jgi:hypothetical protein
MWDGGVWMSTLGHWLLTGVLLLATRVLRLLILVVIWVLLAFVVERITRWSNPRMPRHSMHRTGWRISTGWIAMLRRLHPRRMRMLSGWRTMWMAIIESVRITRMSWIARSRLTIWRWSTLLLLMRHGIARWGLLWASIWRLLLLLLVLLCSRFLVRCIRVFVLFLLFQFLGKFD